MSEKQRPSIGRIVHLRLGDAHKGAEPTYAPAIVVSCWTPKMANLRVFEDSPNVSSEQLAAANVDSRGWVGSAHEGDDVGQWRWPPRV